MNPQPNYNEIWYRSLHGRPYNNVNDVGCKRLNDLGLQSSETASLSSPFLFSKPHGKVESRKRSKRRGVSPK